jgi:transcriptional regulator with XRE-family HTH domain
MDGRELLADYIRTNPASQAKLARDVGCSEGHLSLILAKKRWASPDLAQKLSQATGAVPADELVSPYSRKLARDMATLMGAD